MEVHRKTHMAGHLCGAGTGTNCEHPQKKYVVHRSNAGKMNAMCRMTMSKHLQPLSEGASLSDVVLAELRQHSSY